MDRMFGGAVRTDSRRGDGAMPFSSRRSVEEDSWTEVERQELDHATSFVSDSMYLVMENPAGALYMGETVHFKVHALCDQSTLGRVAGVTGKKKPPNDEVDDVMHGTLFLTSYRLLFRSFHQHHEEELVEVHLNNIAELAEFRVNGKLGPMSQLEVSCKNFELIKFNFPGEAVSGDVYVKMNQLLMGKLQPAAYAFARQPDTSGWAAYDPQAEFTRLGFKMPKSGAQIGGFRIAHINSNYKMSPTYPSSFVVPASVSDGELRKISFFRARGRVPAVTYRHKNDAVVARCAQPLVGLRRKRCTSDEAYMIALRRECKGKLLFIDCRSQTSAYGNIALGGGFEVLDYYKETNIMFMGIENIHSMRDSIRKLFDLIKNEIRGNERSNWLSCLESTRWLEHVRSILVSCSVCIAKLVEGTSLMIHCSDGWDRTAQITALVKLCADPFYRTVKGFQVLIEQEWCAFGHQFRARSGHTDTQAAYWEDDSTSPVFLQFVDAVWQLMRQFPCSFEFSERYLIALLDEVYSKRSGTFLHDCEEARMRSKTVIRCTSAWTLLDSHPHAADFRNPFFMVPLSGEGSADKSPAVLQCKWHTSSLAIWSSFYLRSLESNDSRDAWAKELQVTQRELQDQLSAAHQQLQSQVEQNSDLQSELEQLRRERAQLTRLLEGEVYSDTLNGLLLHEEDEDDDAVLLSVTPVGESRTTLETPCSESAAAIPGASETKVYSTTGVGCFLGGSMSQDFEILQSYFDPSQHETRTMNELFARRMVVEEVSGYGSYASIFSQLPAPNTSHFAITYNNKVLQMISQSPLAQLRKDGSGSMGAWEGNEDGNLEECKLLSGDFAALLQVLLGLIAISVLVVKRLREVPRRPLMVNCVTAQVWAFDTSKQMIGATFAHVANLMIAILLYSYQAELEQSEDEQVDQCALYFVNFTLDTTLGVFLNYVLLSAVVLLALRFGWPSLKIPGDYGTPVRVRTWLLQVISWVVVIFTCKFIIASLIVAFQKPLGAFAVLLFKPLDKHPEVELALVMIACPCLMNALQFWIQDNFLKKDVRDESFIVAQAAQSPTGSLNGDGKLPSLGTPTDDECSEPGEGDPKLMVINDGNTQEPGLKKKLELDLSSV
ncbi:hypothetical protein PHYPSEUDO_014942 [Phytophthora pseudosyringae]|uniref:Myotubularin phosphatase domain-containing protein n=1 Tax=Phytophthora pseudosyringae TaxID=221518 RepID=A0A8T1W317_9STRA|nr:hypothetical protein PHYPSEUDO_014942 [Phytophthora pseudosyringae]